jgi:ATP-dependent protease Clp ATPase subunit
MRFLRRPGSLADCSAARTCPTSISSPKSLVAHLNEHVIGQDIAKRRLALGVTNHYKRLNDDWDKDAPDPIVTDADLRDVVIESG